MVLSDLLIIVSLTAGAGLGIPAGGLMASIERIRPHWLEAEFRHFVIALGGGILLGAVALVLVPEGIDDMRGSLWVFPLFFAGGLVFFFIERALGLRRREAPQMTGTLLDYIPEAAALGGLLATGSESAPLLAFLIGVQNLPEGFNAYRELVPRSANTPGKTLLFLCSLVPLGPLAGACGYMFLTGHESVLGGIMLFAAGGMLYLIFQDIAPQSRLNKHWAPPLGAVIGFGLALAGYMLSGNA